MLLPEAASLPASRLVPVEGREQEVAGNETFTWDCGGLAQESPRKKGGGAPGCSLSAQGILGGPTP